MKPQLPRVIERTESYLLAVDARGNTFKVSPEDEHLLYKYNWRVETHSKANYIRVACSVLHETLNRPKTVLLHRLIMNTPDGLYVDHKNHDETDNTRPNLRNVTQSQNLQNRRKSSTTKTSIYKGVCLDKNTGSWKSAITANGKFYYLGLFDTEEEAAETYNMMAVQLHGEFAYLNQI